MRQFHGLSLLPSPFRSLFQSDCCGMITAISAPAMYKCAPGSSLRGDVVSEGLADPSNRGCTQMRKLFLATTALVALAAGSAAAADLPVAYKAPPVFGRPARISAASMSAPTSAGPTTTSHWTDRDNWIDRFRRRLQHVFAEHEPKWLGRRSAGRLQLAERLYGVRRRDRRKLGGPERFEGRLPPASRRAGPDHRRQGQLRGAPRGRAPASWSIT